MRFQIHRYSRTAYVAVLLVAVLNAAIPFGLPSSLAQGEQQAAPVTGGQESDQESDRGETPIDPGSAAEAAGAEQAALTQQQAVSHYYLAMSYFQRWMIELAGVELEEAILIWPDFKLAHRDLCVIDILTGHPLKALAELMMVVGLGEPIPLTASERDELNKRAAKLHYKLGIACGAQKQWSEAATEFEWALSYCPNSAAIYHSLAFACANAGNFDKAERFYETTFKMSPTDPFSHADFAFMLSDAGKKQQAEQQLAQAVKLAPSAAALHVDLGWMSESGGDFNKAEKEFRAAVEISPEHAGLWAHLGRVLEHQGKNPEAIEAYRKALQIDPDEDEVKQRLAKLQGNGTS